MVRWPGWPAAFGIGAGGTGASSMAGVLDTRPAGGGAGGAGVSGALAATGDDRPPPRPPEGGVGPCAPVRSRGGRSGANGFGAAAVRQFAPGRAATGAPSWAAFIKRLQISTGRLPLGLGLHPWVDRGRHHDVLVDRPDRVVERVHHIIGGVVDRAGRLVAPDLRRIGERHLGLGLGDVTLLGHGGDDLRGALVGAGEIVVGREPGRRLHQSGQQRRLRQRESQEYFADGMVEDIITGLSRIKWLFVIARNSSFVYKGKTAPGTGWLTLDHDAIKGFMCAMEMMFQVKSPDLSKDLHPGDVVDFKIDAAKYVIVEVQRVDPAK